MVVCNTPSPEWSSSCTEDWTDGHYSTHSRSPGTTLSGYGLNTSGTGRASPAYPANATMASGSHGMSGVVTSTPTGCISSYASAVDPYARANRHSNSPMRHPNQLHRQRQPPRQHLRLARHAILRANLCQPTRPSLLRLRHHQYHNLQPPLRLGIRLPPDQRRRRNRGHLRLLRRLLLRCFMFSCLLLHDGQPGPAGV